MSEEAPILGEEQGPALVPFGAYVDKERRFSEALASSELQASMDLPTGILNKASFERLMEDRIAEAEKSGEEEPTLAAILMDTTGYKKLNDKLGHVAGDQYLVDLTSSLPKWFRPDDAITLLGRIGGDEIAVILDLRPRDIYDPKHQTQASHTGNYGSEQRLATVLARFNECKEDFFANQPEEIKQMHQRHELDLAAGAALWQHGWDVKQLIKAADFSMYKQKGLQYAQWEEFMKNDPDFEQQAIAKARKILEEAGREDLAEKLDEI